eukprot:28963-Eustigmatos_ZCMA.PRE.1
MELQERTMWCTSVLAASALELRTTVWPVVEQYDLSCAKTSRHLVKAKRRLAPAVDDVQVGALPGASDSCQPDEATV